MKLAQICLAGICLVGAVGCDKSAPSALRSAPPEYTNSIQGEINQRVLTVKYGYAAGFAAATIKEENEKLEKIGGHPLPLPTHYNDMVSDEDAVVKETIATFWYLQTNSEARARANTHK